MTKFLIYTREDPPCGYCVSAKRLLENKGFAFTNQVVGRDLLMEEFKEKFPDQRTVPLIFADEEGLRVRVGGYNELQTYITQLSVKGLNL